MNIPSIRRFFVPDPGYVLLEGDLKGADAQIVAWEANDESLKELFRQGRDLHNENAREYYGLSFTKADRQISKSRVHALDYGGKSKTLSINFSTSIAAEEAFLQWWFKKHPAILSWHKKIDRQLQLTRQVSNVFGYRRYYFDRIEGLLPEALAWIGQSTTAITINHAFVALDEAAQQGLPIEILLQVHDSLLMQIPRPQFTLELFQTIQKLMSVSIPYPDPLIIPVEFKWSPISWGDMQPVTEGTWV